MSEHTQGKLEYAISTCNSVEIVSADDETVIIAESVNDDYEITDLQIANARHLVKCWNCHDELVTALHDLTRMFRQQNRDCDTYFQYKQAKEAFAKATN